MTAQTINGKAFEFALLSEFKEILSTKTTVLVLENEPFRVAKKCFESLASNQKDQFLLVSCHAVEYLIGMEPRLSNDISKMDTLQLEIVSDRLGQSGDVRDVIAVRSSQKWEIGISAKNNHRAVKHSRLSNDIDFGEKWLGIPCSKQYFNEIKPVFDELAELRKQSNAEQKWESLGAYHDSVYLPILRAFMKELNRLDNENQGKCAQRLVEYLIGTKDFYKVIKGDKKVEIQAYNLHGTLNMGFKSIKPKFNVPRLKLPNRLIEVVFQENSETTLIVTLSDGWQISFRIHNASSKIEPSLKFDINLISAPKSLFVQHIPIDKNFGK